MSRLAIMLVGLLLAASLAWAGTPAMAAARSWTVIAGGATRDYGVWSNAYNPRKIEVAVGDTVVWKFAGFHTVTFLGGTVAALPSRSPGARSTGVSSTSLRG